MRFLLYLTLILLLVNPSAADVRFLSISDIHYGSDNTAGDGHDTNDLLLSNALHQFSRLSHRVDFIITLGDFPTHMLRSSPRKETYIKKVFHELYEANDVRIPLFFVSGNNDPLHGNYQPFSWQGKSLLELAPDWQGACAHCKGLMIDGTHMRDEGYYSSYVIPHNKDIVLIALNSTEFAKHPFFMPPYSHQNSDALKQLDWLTTQLKNHHAKQLLIAMHIPPGTDYKGGKLWQEPYLKQFIYLLNHYHHQYGQITLLTAHTHMDDIRKIQLNHGVNVYAFATPSISRIHHNNPAMKIFDLGPQLKLKNYTTYYTTTDNPWENKQYSAIKHSNSLFPQCLDKSLANCLNSLTNKTVCNILSHGKFYGAKSLQVDGTVCTLTYPVN